MPKSTHCPRIGKFNPRKDSRWAKLNPAVLGCFQDEIGHVSIVPIDSAGEMDKMKLAEWAATRGSAAPHPFTKMIVVAVVERNVRRSP